MGLESGGWNRDSQFELGIRLLESYIAGVGHKAEVSSRVECGPGAYNGERGQLTRALDLEFDRSVELAVTDLF